MAERTGLEPATTGVTGQYSNQLNYRSETVNSYQNVMIVGGGCCRGRTCDLWLVRPPLSQLS